MRVAENILRKQNSQELSAKTQQKGYTKLFFFFFKWELERKPHGYPKGTGESVKVRYLRKDNLEKLTFE